MKKEDKLKSKSHEISWVQPSTEGGEAIDGTTEAESTEGVEKGATCLKCLQDFKKDESYEAHAALDHKYQCNLSSYCNLSFVWKSELDLHLSVEHSFDACMIESSSQTECNDSGAEEWSSSDESAEDKGKP